MYYFTCMIIFVTNQQLKELEEAHMLRGELTATQQLTLISSYDDLSQALEGAFFVQECVFEQLEIKQSVFQEVEQIVGKDVILSSSTSCLVPSSVFSTVQNKSRCLVSHPVNPPYYVKLVELVPHPQTTATIMDTTHALMTKVNTPHSIHQISVDLIVIVKIPPVKFFGPLMHLTQHSHPAGDYVFME
uniref:Crystallin, lambda 1 n=1 Tax=Oryzias sinensis TaxID=183150 RepID=A0A8C7WUW4_9TELE